MKARVLSSVAEVSAPAWDALGGSDHPFVSHAFLTALEESGSVGPGTGWTPRHLALDDEHGRLVGAVPLYLKTHSWGEYVFDHGWADAARRAGLRYYPKLQAAVPFTPVTGPRLLGPTQVRPALVEALAGVHEGLGVSSLHVTFPTEGECQALESAGFLTRVGVQFHWENRGYASFDDFLGALSSRKRKTLRKERDAVRGSGLQVEVLQGGDIQASHLAAMHRFYVSTVDRKWGSAYLTEQFWPELHRRLGERMVLVMAFSGGVPVAGAFHVVGAETLYGRHWGCDGDHAFLHFECCYYRAMEYAVAHGLSRVEAGAQGVHKVGRGYLPVRTFSAHRLRHPGLREAVARFLEAERVEVEEEMDALRALSPFREGGGPG